MRAMKKTYHDDELAERIFYATENKRKGKNKKRSKDELENY